MNFCDKCDSKLIKTTKGDKCPRCDKESLEQIDKNLEKEKITITRYSIGQDFPFEKNQYYTQKDVRKSLGCDLMSGINYNKEGNFLVLFMNAHELTGNTNPYHDYYESETGLYHYTGKGKKGEQTLAGINGILEKANENDITIHFFMQQSVRSNHQYMGKVKLEKTMLTIQPDRNSKNRKVYEFLLKPIE